MQNPGQLRLKTTAGTVSSLVRPRKYAAYIEYR
jgi:hypothetical protein